MTENNMMIFLTALLIIVYGFETHLRVQQRKEDLKDMEEFRARLMRNDRK
jgi:hypothetical protein